MSISNDNGVLWVVKREVAVDQSAVGEDFSDEEGCLVTNSGNAAGVLKYKTTHDPDTIWTVNLAVGAMLKRDVVPIAVRTIIHQGTTLTGIIRSYITQ